MSALTDRLKSWPLYVLPHHLVSRIVFKLTRIESRFVPRVIKIFCNLFNVDLAEASDPQPQSYATFNQFFTRPLKPKARTIEGTETQFACPVDGRVSEIGPITNGVILQAKNHNYLLTDLLGGRESDYKAFEQGSFATLYLSPRDYHRIHMPVAATLCSMHYIPGRLFSVAPHTVRVVPRLFARNERVVTIFDSRAGKVALVLVGAINVAAIETVWAGLVTPPASVKIVHKDYDAGVHVFEKGQEMGRFNMGSTVIALFENATLDSNLKVGNAVRMGQLLGEFGQSSVLQP